MARTSGNLGLLLAGSIGLALLARELVRQRSTADLWGEVALVTGGSRGLGLLIARELAGQGCRIAICARDGQELARAAEDIRSHGAAVLPVVCDVSDQRQVEAMIQQVTEHYGRIDLLVNNAGIIQVGPIESQTLEDFEQAMNSMYWGTVYPTLAVLPQMQNRRSGRICNITSIGGKVSVPHLLPYSTAKFAAVGFSEGLRAELKDQGITVTTIVPGLMRTGSTYNAFFKGDHQGEYTWFSLGGNLPLISMDAERAAQQVVDAIRRGEAERILSLPATVLAKLHGLFPGLTQEIMAIVDQVVLPKADRPTPLVRGMELENEGPTAIRRPLTTLGRAAAERFNQYPGTTHGGKPASPLTGEA